MQNSPKANLANGPAPDAGDRTPSLGSRAEAAENSGLSRAAADPPNGNLGTAGDVRQFDFKGTMEYVLKLVKNNPGPALVTAAVLGFLVARTLSRD